MPENAARAVAIVGVGAILPDAPDAETYWENVKSGRYSISEVPADRWSPELYYDADHDAPEKTYSTIGGWVRKWPWAPLEWRLPIPPKVAEAMDRTHRWAISATREALGDYGYPERPLDPDRTAVVFGNAMGGDRHYMTALRIYFPEYADELASSPEFASLDEATRGAILAEFQRGVRERFPEISEDTMPGELSNIIAGRVANLWNFHGPNFVVDAACASAMAAIDAAVEGLEQGDYDAVLTGGMDGNMSASTFTKFCKIGALSATGTRPYGEGADGFVMGEGAAVLLLKRLADAERDGDHIYAVIRGIGGASDGKGKSVTAPNPVGQRLAVERAWTNAGTVPDAATYIEGHGTSTRVGDVVEVQGLSEVFSGLGLAPGSIPLGSVKSNIGHLKGAAGAAGMLKAALALDRKTVPPSINVTRTNPNIDFENSPLYVNTELRQWKTEPGQVRRAGVSAFGFGGTNFHIVLEEYVPGRLQVAERRLLATEAPTAPSLKAPLRGALVVGAQDDGRLIERLRAARADAADGITPPPAAPAEADLRAPVRVAIDYGDAAELEDKLGKVLRAVESGHPAAWKLLNGLGAYLGRGPAHQVALLYTGQGSQYTNMLAELRSVEPIVADTFTEADDTMTTILGKPLTDYIFNDPDDAEAMAVAERELMQTEITQPAVLATDEALTRLLAAYGVKADMVMGHSLGEYGALVAAGALPFGDALEAVAARGREMAHLSQGDNGLMAAVFAPIDETREIVDSVDGYVVIANVNSTAQAVIGGATPAVEEAMAKLAEREYQVVQLPVSHAFHTEIIAPAAEPLMQVLRRLDVKPPVVPVVANVDGEFYPMGPAVAPRMVDILGKQIASPVQFVKGLETLYEAGARVFVEVGPKRALHGFVEDVLGDRPDVVGMHTNHPKAGDLVSFNRALCGLYAAGLGVGTQPVREASPAPDIEAAEPVALAAAPAPRPVAAAESAPPASGDTFVELGKMFAEFLERGYEVYQQGAPVARSGGNGIPEPVVVTGAALGLPGTHRVFDDANVGRILHGDQFIDTVPVKVRQAMVDHHITRLVKSENGGGRFETIESQAEVIKLAAQGGMLDLAEEFGYPAERVPALDIVTELAIGAGIDALRDAGIPLTMHYKTTTVNTKLPERWGLPEPLRDETGVIFASAFPGVNSLVDEVTRYEQDRARRDRLASLNHLRDRISDDDPAVPELDHMIREVVAELEAQPYVFDRRFLFKVLSMGHSQFAEYIGARGPNTQINSACASTTQAVALAEDWIRAGRCRRVIIVSADDVTTDQLMGWIGSGFLATGAAATDEVVEDAALPFDKRRHGLLLGMGGAAIVIETAAAARERGIAPIAEVLSAVTANSAFHGTRLDVDHIRFVMADLMASAEQRWGVNRHEIAPQLMFVSHETYTPARGGSAQAEVDALRHVFGPSSDRIVIANTKGFTGHPMGVGIEDVVAIKSLETGLVPPIANVKEVDPDFGHLNLSKGGAYPIQYALRLGAGFGSQISLSLIRWYPSPHGIRPEPHQLGYEYRVTDEAVWRKWLADVSGYEAATVEQVRRTLRIVDSGPPQRAPVAPAWSQVVSRRSPVAQSPVASPQFPVASPLSPVSSHQSPVASPQSPVAAPVVETPAAEAVVDPVEVKVLEIVAAQTGYPADMLDLDLDLEADLGIDTVKQAETFAAIREEYGIERDDNIALRDYPTLGSVIGFVYDKADGLEQSPVASPQSPVAAPVVETPAAEAVVDPVEVKVLEIVAAQTGYPADMLDLDLDLEADLGIDTVKQAETFAAIREEYGIERDDNIALRDYPTLGSVIGFVYDKADGLEQSPVASPQSPVAAPVVETPAAEAVVDPVEVKVLEIVAAQTGYPADMLDLDLDLEADLGIDTVKQAETFAAIREEYGIERDDNIALRDYPTLGSVIGFVYDKADGLEQSPVASPQSPVAAPVVETPAAEAVVDPVEVKVLEIVAAQTGYPADMLDLDLDLEADLGIDTVKQAETFAAIREEYGIERDDNIALRDYPTLGSVIGFVYDKADGLEQSPVASPQSPVAAPAAAAPAAGLSLTEGDDGEAAGVVPRMPVPVLRPSLDKCVPTGVEIGEGSRVVVMMDAGGVGTALVKRLEKLGASVLAIDDAPDAETLTRRVEDFAPDGATGVFWLPGLDIEDFSSMDHAAWREALRVRVKLLYATMRHQYETGAFLVTGTRLGGRHGYDAAGARAPMGGAVTGFAKAYKRERPDVIVKAVDFAPGRKTAAPADALIAEALRDPGAVEIGYLDGERWTVALTSEVPEDGAAGLELTPESVLVVTGAAGSIVSAIIADLARGAGGGTFHLLDLAAAPDPGDPDIRMFETDQDALKRALFERIKEAEGRATPATVDRELAQIERRHASAAAIAAIEAAGGTVHYHQVNLLDADAMGQVVEQIREGGRVDLLLHAGGLEISRLLPDKEPSEFDLVFDVKADGWFHLIKGLEGISLGAVVAFSSIAGRFGNGGQTDYSAANDMLCKAISHMRTVAPSTRGLAVDWTAWADIGMATRGSIPTVMKAAGIDMLPARAGIPIVRLELGRPATTRELVIAGRLGILEQELHPTGGVDTASLLAGAEQNLAMVGALGATASGLRAGVELNPGAQPFLYDHQIDGTPVLPGVMGIEAFAETAGLAFPDLHVAAIEDVDFHAPFKFYRHEPREVLVEASFTRDGDDVLARCRLVGVRTLAGQEQPQRTVHFTGTVRLSAEPPQPTTATPLDRTDAAVALEAIYTVYFHGPAYQVLSAAWRSGETVAGLMPEKLPDDRSPDTALTTVNPRVLELCFQTAGVWEIGTTGEMGLPLRVGSYVPAPPGREPQGRLQALVTAGDDGSFTATVVDEVGTGFGDLTGYRTVRLPGALDDAALSPLRDAMADGD